MTFGFADGDARPGAFDADAETIVALSSGPPPAGVAVIRVSGPAVSEVLEAIAGGVPPARRGVLRTLRGGDGEPLDRALVLFMPGPASFTGEDVAEFHVHGGRAVIEAVIARIRCCGAGVRMAQAGEFARRGFLNGRADLTEIEGMADLIAAETAAQHRQAVRQMSGGLQAGVTALRESLVRCLGLLEAAIDFPDEEIPDYVLAEVDELILGMTSRVTQYIESSYRGERLRQGFRVAILGPPNVGKSSLLNCLARREAAIVSARAGTTRDVLEVHLDLGGYPVTLIDTAGLRETDDMIEAEGVRRARRAAEDAELRLLLFASDAREETADNLFDYGGPEAIWVMTKSDLGDHCDADSNSSAVPVSALTGAGIDRLVACIAARVADHAGPQVSDAVLTRARHREAFEAVLEALGRARTATMPELKAEDLRLAARSLGRVTGAVDVDDVLDVVFSEFCIGK